MDVLLFFLVLFLVVAFAFYGGIILGITDCKRRYGIPSHKDPDSVVWFLKCDDAITVPKWEWEQLCEIESAYIALQGSAE